MLPSYRQAFTKRQAVRLAWRHPLNPTMRIPCQRIACTVGIGNSAASTTGVQVIAGAAISTHVASTISELLQQDRTIPQSTETIRHDVADWCWKEDAGCDCTVGQDAS